MGYGRGLRDLAQVTGKSGDGGIRICGVEMTIDRRHAARSIAILLSVALLVCVGGGFWHRWDRERKVREMARRIASGDRQVSVVPGFCKATQEVARARKGGLGGARDDFLRAICGQVLDAKKWTKALSGDGFDGVIRFVSLSESGRPFVYSFVWYFDRLAGAELTLSLCPEGSRLIKPFENGSIADWTRVNRLLPLHNGVVDGDEWVSFLHVGVKDDSPSSVGFATADIRVQMLRAQIEVRRAIRRDVAESLVPLLIDLRDRMHERYDDLFVPISDCVSDL